MARSPGHRPGLRLRGLRGQRPAASTGLRTSSPSRRPTDSATVPRHDPRPEPPHDPDRDALEAALAGRGEYELFACDPALADTATFCAAYGFAPEDSANTIVVVGKGTPPVYAACVVLATHRLAVNQVVKVRFGRKSSFASPEETQAITGHEIGGVTVFGLPPDLPVWVDARGHGARADRPRRRQPQLEGDRARIDPADAAERGGRRGAGEPGSPARGLTRLRWAHDEQGTPAHRGRVRHRPGGRGHPRDGHPRRGRGRRRLAEPGRRRPAAAPRRRPASAAPPIESPSATAEPSASGLRCAIGHARVDRHARVHRRPRGARHHRPVRASSWMRRTTRTARTAPWASAPMARATSRRRSASSPRRATW